MDSTRITDFATLQSYAVRDKMLLQRLEAGVWNDYYTEVGDYLGQYLTKIIDWDMSLALAELIQPATPGNYLVVLDAQAVYTPGASFTGNPVQILVYPDGAPYSSVMEFVHASTGRANTLTQLDPDGTLYDYITQDINIVSGFTAADGTCRIQVRYVEVTPI